MTHLRNWLAVIGVIAVSFETGCGPRDETSTYRIPKRTTVNARNVQRTRQRFRKMSEGQDGDDGVYAAMIPVLNHLWMIEVNGPRDRLAEHTGEFLDFIVSLEFTGKVPPGKVGENWKQVNRSGALLAFQIDEEEDPLVLTMNRFPMARRDGKDIPASMLMAFTVNQWRRDLSLDPIRPDELPDHTAVFYPANRTALAIHLVGTRDGSAASQDGLPPGHPPVGSGGGPSPGGQPSSGQTAEAEAPPSRLEYTVPEGWDPGQRVVSRGGITVTRDAAFVVSEGEAKVEITATPMSPSAASLGQNVTRWRRQVGLGPIPEDELDEAVQEIPVGELAGRYIEAVSPEGATATTAIFAAIAKQGETAWVFTLKGDADLARQQREEFQMFLKSIRFKEADGADDGK